MRARCTFAAAVAAASLLATCSWGSHAGGVRGAQLHVVAAAPLSAAAAAMRVQIFECDGDRPLSTRTISFESDSPAGLAGVAEWPLRLHNAHLFGEELWTGEAGCYRTVAEPVDVTGAVIEGCTRAETPALPVGSETAHRFLLLSRCGQGTSDLPRIERQINFGPSLSDLQVRSQAPTKSDEPGVEACARVRDPEGDAIELSWEARDDDGRTLALPEAHRSEQVDDVLQECIRLDALPRPFQVAATAWDGRHDPQGEFLSHEDRHFYRHGIAAPSRATKTARVSRSSAAREAERCALEELPRVSEWSYWIRRDGRLLEPTDDIAAIEAGDQLEVDLQIDGDCGKLPVSLVSRRAGEAHKGTSAFDHDSGTFESGRHLLAVDVPRGHFELRLAVDQPAHIVLDSTAP